MTKPARTVRTVFGIVALLCAQGLSIASAQVTDEQKLIDELVGYVAAMKDIRFLRNGNEYSVTEAVTHMQRKREYFADRIKTADDFIRLCATRSEVSGKLYRIRFSDGTVRDAATILRKRLRELRQAKHRSSVHAQARLA